MNRRLLFALALACLAPALAAPPESGYQMPPQELRALVDANNPPGMVVDPYNRYLVLAHRPSLLALGDLAQPELKLAGLRFNPNNRASGRDKYITGLSLRGLMQGPEKPVEGLPANPRLAELRWSPDGQSLAFVHVAENESQLWHLDLKTGRARRLPGVSLNGLTGFDFQWLPDSRQLVALVSANNGPAPQPSALPSGPSIQEHKGGKASARTYQDLLKSSEDEALFEHYLASRVVRVALDGKAPVPLGPPGLYIGLSASPDGQYLLVSSLHRPFSYLQPYSSFPLKSEVWDAQGRAVKTLRDLPLEENTPPDYDAVRPGVRNPEWRADAPHELVWVESLDGGDARKPSEFRDQLFRWQPGESQPRPWLKLQLRYGGIDWGDGQHALVREGWHKTRRSRTHWVQPERPEVAPVTVFDRSSEDRYGNPGAPMKRTLANGQRVLWLGPEESLYLVGEGASPEGDRPFLDRLPLASLKPQRLFQSQQPHFERPVRLLDEDQLLLTCESLDGPPNLLVQPLTGGSGQALTDFVHPAPQLKAVKKEILHYKRADGVELTGTLYTPPGYDPQKDGRLPLFIWAYPGEFKSAAAAGQVKGSPHQFIRPWWGGPLFFVMRGYAVLEDPTFPIIGEGDREPNDTYLEQLVMDAQAAVDAVVARGVADPERCAIGGHSYGAFTTANLLAHSNIFRAGIARSGAYNRTLTPFGFQAEERNYWEARDTYTRMSPFTYADKIDEPLLLIHGQEDNNSGTFPIQSERLYQAIKGLGGRARLVTLPRESHGYAARESVMHTLYEMDRWLEQHVKKAPPRSENRP